MLNHFDHQTVGSTHDNLELVSDQFGLAFRYRITDSEDGTYIKSMAASQNSCVSIEWRNAITKMRAGVTCIVDAELFHISYQHGRNAGLMKQAFATLQDVDYGESLRDMCAGGRLLHAGAAVGVTRTLEELLISTAA